MSQKNFAQMQSLILYERWQILTDWECVAEKKKNLNILFYFLQVILPMIWIL